MRDILAFLHSKVNRWSRVEDSFCCFLNKGGRASSDLQSEMQVCFQGREEDLLDAKFQNMLWNEYSPPNDCVMLNVVDECSTKHC